eukprot:9809479-Karenia_brevis.AAC.1
MNRTKCYVHKSGISRRLFQTGKTLNAIKTLASALFMSTICSLSRDHHYKGAMAFYISRTIRVVKCSRHSCYGHRRCGYANAAGH